jgi:hypothetical protein
MMRRWRRLASRSSLIVLGERRPSEDFVSLADDLFRLRRTRAEEIWSKALRDGGGASAGGCHA